MFFSIRADITDSSGIANVERYMKGVFYAVTAIGIAFAIQMIPRIPPIRR